MRYITYVTYVIYVIYVMYVLLYYWMMLYGELNLHENCKKK